MCFINLLYFFTSPPQQSPLFSVWCYFTQSLVRVVLGSPPFSDVTVHSILLLSTSFISFPFKIIHTAFLPLLLHIPFSLSVLSPFHLPSFISSCFIFYAVSGCVPPCFSIFSSALFSPASPPSPPLSPFHGIPSFLFSSRSAQDNISVSFPLRLSRRKREMLYQYSGLLLLLFFFFFYIIFTFALCFGFTCFAFLLFVIFHTPSSSSNTYLSSFYLPFLLSPRSPLPPCYVTSSSTASAINSSFLVFYYFIFHHFPLCTSS